MGDWPETKSCNAPLVPLDRTLATNAVSQNRSSMENELHHAT